MGRTCEVYSSFDRRFKIFAPSQLRSEGDALVFVYTDTFVDRAKAWWTRHQLESHGGYVYGITASPHLDYKHGPRDVSSVAIVSLNVGSREAIVRVQRDFFPGGEMDMEEGK